MSVAVRIKVRLLRKSASLPIKMSDGSAGADLKACLESDLVIPAGGYATVPTGIAIAIPAGFEGEVRPRSGLASKYGITLLNSPGTIDSDYRGEVMVVLINHGNEVFIVRNGDRIAQLLIKPIVSADFVEVESLMETNRGTGGFGSTGI